MEMFVVHFTFQGILHSLNMKTKNSYISLLNSVLLWNNKYTG